METTKDKVQYSIVGYDNNNGSYIVSGYSVADFGAVGDGTTDDTAAIRAALNAAQSAGGAVVYLPAGKYRITEPGLSVTGGVTLIGQWNDPNGTSGKAESVLVADYPAGEDAPLLQLSVEASILNLCIYYPRQTVENPLPYAWAISTEIGGGSSYANTVTVKGITLYNAFRGIEIIGSGQHLSHIYGTVLSEGIRIGWNAEVSEFLSVGFDSSFWNTYDGTDRTAIAAYTKENATAIRFGRCDDYLLYDVNCPEEEFCRGIYFSIEENYPHVAYGGCYRLHGTAVSFEEGYTEAAPSSDWPVNRFLDGIPGTEVYSFDEPTERFSTKATLFNVRDYGAKGDGRNDTASFEKALLAAKENGGGIVFVPHGQYTVYSTLTVPENVEVLGESYSYRLGSPSVIRMKKADKFTYALFVLSPNSGVQGLTICQPDNLQEYYELKGFDIAWDTFSESELPDIPETPYIFRGAGKNCYIENCTIINSNYGIDLASTRCDNFVVRGIWATCMDAGIRVGGGSQNGRLSCLFFSYGPWWEREARSHTLEAYTRNKTEAFRFEDCSDILCFSIGCFAVKNAITFTEADGGSPRNISILRGLCDMAYGEAAITFDSGTDISIVFASTGITGAQKKLGRTGGALYVTDAFDGVAYIYGQNLWAGGKNFLSDTVRLYTEASEGDEVATLSHGFTAPDYSYTEASTPTDTPTATATPDVTDAPTPEANTGLVSAIALGLLCCGIGIGICLILRKRKKK